MSDTEKEVAKTIKLRNAVALYTSSVLGSGILVLPGITARIAGPASIIAWVILSLASVPFALTFSNLSSTRPETGGVYSFTRTAFGISSSTAISWLFLLWEMTGAPAVSLVAASYVGYAFGLGTFEVYIIGFAVICSAFFVNFAGIVISNKVQLSIIISIVGLLIVTIISSGFIVRLSNFSPFLPYGIAPIGTSAALIFWSFIGYENVSSIAGEFQNPKRDFNLGALISVVAIGILYVLTSFVTIGTGSYRAGASIAPFAAILSGIFGGYAGIATAILAVFIIFGLVNAYISGMSRVFLKSAMDRGLPSFLVHRNSRTQAPDRVMAMMFLLTIPVFFIYYFESMNLETAFLISGGAAIMVYIISFISAIKIFREERRRNLLWMPAVSLAISIIILYFVGVWIFASFAAIVLAFLFTGLMTRKTADFDNGLDASDFQRP